jgi:hypothetical protein
MTNSNTPDSWKASSLRAVMLSQITQFSVRMTSLALGLLGGWGIAADGTQGNQTFALGMGSLAGSAVLFGVDWIVGEIRKSKWATAVANAINTPADPNVPPVVPDQVKLKGGGVVVEKKNRFSGNSEATRLSGLLLVGMLMLSMVGCANQQTVIYQSAIALDAPVVTTTILLKTVPPKVSPANARDIYAAAVTAQSALVSWRQASTAKDANAATIASAAFNSALQTLAQQLTAIEQSGKVAVDRNLGRRRLQLHFQQPPPTANGKAKIGEVAAVIAIIQLAADLTPQIVAWVNAASAANVTDAQIDAQLQKLDTDLNTLKDAIENAPR